MSLTQVAHREVLEPIIARPEPWAPNAVRFMCGECGAEWSVEATPESVEEANEHGQACKRISVEHQPDVDDNGHLTGLCICGRKMISELGKMKLYCKKGRPARAAQQVQS